MALNHAFILHSRPYREKSRLVDLFSLEHGLVRGVMRQRISPLFQPCLAAWRGHKPLKTLSHCESVGPPVVLEGNALFAGFYLNELLVRLLAEEEAYPDLFVLYAQIILQLQQFAPLEPLLREFEIHLLKELGYALDFSHDTLNHPLNAQAYYQYQAENGLVCVEPHQTPNWQGKHLLAIAQRDWGEAQTRQAAKLILRSALAALLGAKPLKSRELWL